MKKHEKTRERVGYHLYVQDRNESVTKRKSGKEETRKLFTRVGGLFRTKQEARTFAKKHFADRKIHIEGVRINIVPLQPIRRKEEATTNIGTHR